VRKRPVTPPEISRAEGPAVETQGLTKRFGSFVAVDRLDLAVQPGEVFGFLGSNGAGKSTAIRMLCGLLAPSGGTGRVLGVDVARDPEEVKKRIGYMSQRFSLYDDLTVGRNLQFFGGVYGVEGKALRERAAWAVRMAGLEGRENQLTGSLAGGWKQRLALACAVLHRPRVLFLDEPTGGVDPISRRRFWTLIDEMAGEGVTILVTTHYMDEAEHCERIAFLHAGRLIALGSVHDLKGIFAGRLVLEVICPRPLEAMDLLRSLSWVAEISVFGARLHVVVQGTGEAEESRRAVEALEGAGFSPVSAVPIVPSLEDVFIHSIGEEEARRNGAPP
jgi:ABC-2 type transport system ATP-binding protein